jgi:hypothetical protein
MKNLLKVLLILAFTTSAFAGMDKNMPDPKNMTVQQVQAMPDLKNLSKAMYEELMPEVQMAVKEKATTEDKARLGITE